jgi:hypothetical protein
MEKIISTESLTMVLMGWLFVMTEEEYVILTWAGLVPLMTSEFSEIQGFFKNQMNIFCSMSLS